MNDFFRSLFGLSRGGTNRDDNRLFERHDQDERDESIYGPPCEGGCNRHNRDNFDDEPPIVFTFPHPDEMFRHFDSMFRSFDEVFRGMGMADFPTINPGAERELPALPAPPSGSLRDRMLKSPDESLREWPGNDRQPQPPSFFSRLWSRPRPDRKTDSKLDTDLDDVVQSGDLDSVLGDVDTLSPSQRQPSNARMQGAMSVRTYTNNNGKVKERRTQKDALGNEQTVITRSMNGQSHTTTTTKTKTGVTEVTESFTNVDDKDKDDFERRWNSRRSLKSDDQHDTSLLRRSQQDDDGTQQLFGKLFGFDFPGFGRR